MVNRMGQIQRMHFVGIGGVGMSGIAEVHGYQDIGVAVSTDRGKRLKRHCHLPRYWLFSSLWYQ